MLQFASQLVEAALTTAKQLWGTKTINTDSLLHPEPTCSLLRARHRKATPTSTIPITITVHTHTHTHAPNIHNSQDAFLCQTPEFGWKLSRLLVCRQMNRCVSLSRTNEAEVWVFFSARHTMWSLCSQPVSHTAPLVCVLLPFWKPASGDHGAQPAMGRPGGRHDTHAGSSLAVGLYSLTPLFHIAVLLMHPCSYSRSIWCMCQAWGGGLTDYIKLQRGKRAQRCQSGPCDGRSVEQ